MEVLAWIIAVVFVFWFYGTLFGLGVLLRWLEITKND